jgi:hypothetical protein
MAASTDTDSLTTAAYTQVATDSVSGVVQHRGGSLVRIHVGSSLPDVATEDFIIIGSQGNLPTAFSWSGFTTGDDVYARADSGTALVSTVAA